MYSRLSVVISEVLLVHNLCNQKTQLKKKKKKLSEQAGICSYYPFLAVQAFILFSPTHALIALLLTHQ